MLFCLFSAGNDPFLLHSSWILTHVPPSSTGPRDIITSLSQQKYKALTVRCVKWSQVVKYPTQHISIWQPTWDSTSDKFFFQTSIWAKLNHSLQVLHVFALQSKENENKFWSFRNWLLTSVCIFWHLKKNLWLIEIITIIIKKWINQLICTQGWSFHSWFLQHHSQKTHLPYYLLRTGYEGVFNVAAMTGAQSRTVSIEFNRPRL